MKPTRTRSRGLQTAEWTCASPSSPTEGALFVVLAFTFASRYVRRGTRRLLLKVSDNEPVAQILGRLARVALIVLGLFIALGILDLDKTVTSLLAGVGVIEVAGQVGTVKRSA